MADDAYIQHDPQIEADVRLFHVPIQIFMLTATQDEDSFDDVSISDSDSAISGVSDRDKSEKFTIPDS
jgi:hypothetical protein